MVSDAFFRYVVINFGLIIKQTIVGMTVNHIRYIN